MNHHPIKTNIMLISEQGLLFLDEIKAEAIKKN